MKTKLILLALASSLLSLSALVAQNNAATNDARNFGSNLATNFGINSMTTTVTNVSPRNYPRVQAEEQPLLAPGLKVKLQLSEAQRTELKPIEDDFASTSREYRIANQPRIDAAHEANRQARVSKDPAGIQAAQVQLQQVWAGLQPYREAAINQVKPLLTPGQLTILDDPKNQWGGNYAVQGNDLPVK
jgi:hypothetical protein